MPHYDRCNPLPEGGLTKAFAGSPGVTYSAVLRNIHGDDKSFEASYAVIALQMLPHAVGPLVAEGKWKLTLKNFFYFFTYNIFNTILNAYEQNFAVQGGKRNEKKNV